MICEPCGKEIKEAGVACKDCYMEIKRKAEAKDKTNKTLHGMLQNVKAHTAKLEQFIEADDLEGARGYLAECEGRQG